MRSRTTLACIFAAVLAALAIATPARADVTTAARESVDLIERGLDLRERGKDAEALPLFEQAFALDPSPRACAQLALAKQALGRWVDAEAGLVRVLEGSVDAPADPWVTQHRAILEKALATVRGQLGWLEVETNVAGAAVSIDGARMGSTPLAEAMRVPAGVVSLEVRAPGYAPSVRLVRVAAGEHARESLELVAAHAAEGSSASASPLHEDDAASSRVHRDEPAPPRRSHTAAWLALGGGATLIAGGIVASIVREREVAIWNDSDACLQGTATRQATCGGHQATANTATFLSVIGYAGGGALAATSLILFLGPGSAQAASTRHGSAVTARCGAGIASIACAGTF
jgi:hypothetical protein